MRNFIALILVLASVTFIAAAPIDHSPIPVAVPVVVPDTSVQSNCPGGICPLPGSVAGIYYLPSGVQGACSSGSCQSSGSVQGGYYESYQGSFVPQTYGGFQRERWYPGKIIGRFLRR